MVGMNRSILDVDILSCFCWLGVPFFWFLLATLEFRKVELPCVVWVACRSVDGTEEHNWPGKKAERDLRKSSS